MRSNRRPSLANPHDDVLEGNLRTCIAGGGEHPPAGLIRLCLSPDGIVTPDLGAKLGGRGAWISADKQAIERAASKGLFARAFKKPASAPENLAALIEAGLEKRALAALGLARRTGDAVAGFDQVKAALEKGRAQVLIAAADAGADGQSKLARIARALPRVVGFSSAALSAALGKDKVVHAALVKGPAAARFLSETTRLQGFRPGLIEIAEALK
ncbi:MAG: RNA-binding protein [Parvularculaceae bacterium]|nr:RNA-binding protein [Parvularculaceae bacterium]